MSTKRIFKYLLKLEHKVDVYMPKGAQILHVHVQNDDVYLWALVDPTANDQCRSFEIHGTGHAIHNIDQLCYIGTVHIEGAAQVDWVWHVFERLPLGATRNSERVQTTMAEPCSACGKLDANQCECKP